jgi:hypothetical protein
MPLLITHLTSDVLNNVLHFLWADGLCSFAQSCRNGAESSSQQQLWRELFFHEPWTSSMTHVLKASLVEETGTCIDFRALYRSALLRELGAVVVELGTHTHKIGHCFWSTPRLVPKEVLDYTYLDLFSLASEDEETLPAFVRALLTLVPSAASVSPSSPIVAASGATAPSYSSARDLSVLFVLPPFAAARHVLLLFAKRLLRSGCRRVRFESAAVCACRTNNVRTAVVLDVGWEHATAIAIVEASVPTHMMSLDRESAVDAGVLRPDGGGAAVRRRLQAMIGEEVDVEEHAMEHFQREHCYVRLVGTADRPPSTSEIELASVHLADRSGQNHDMGEARFAATEGLFRPPPVAATAAGAAAAAPTPNAAQTPSQPPVHAPNAPLISQQSGHQQQPLGLHDMIHRAISLAVPKGSFLPPALRQDLYSNIIVSGGCAALPGLDRRLRRDLQRALPASTSSHVVSGRLERDRRCIAAWQGAAQLARGDADEDAPPLYAPPGNGEVAFQPRPPNDKSVHGVQGGTRHGAFTAATRKQILLGQAHRFDHQSSAVGRWIPR